MNSDSASHKAYTVLRPNVKVQEILLNCNAELGIHRTSTVLGMVRVGMPWMPKNELSLYLTILVKVMTNLLSHTLTPPLQSVSFSNSNWEKVAINIIGPFTEEILEYESESQS